MALVASGGWWQRAQLRQRLLRTSLLSTTQDRKMRGPWAERGQGDKEGCVQPGRIPAASWTSQGVTIQTECIPLAPQRE